MRSGPRLHPCGPALVSGATASRRRMIMWLRPSCLPSRWREVARSAGGWSRRPRCRRVAADPSAVAVETEPAFDPLRFRIVRCREGGLKVPWRYAAVIRTADRRNPVRCLRFRFRRRLSGRPVVRSRLFHLGGESPYPPRQDGAHRYLPRRHKSRRTMASSGISDAESSSASHIPEMSGFVRNLGC